MKKRKHLDENDECASVRLVSRLTASHVYQVAALNKSHGSHTNEVPGAQLQVRLSVTKLRSVEATLADSECT